MKKKLLIMIMGIFIAFGCSASFAEDIYLDGDQSWDGNGDGYYMTIKPNTTKEDLVILAIENGTYSYYARIPGTTDLEVVESGNTVGYDRLYFIIKNGENFQYGSRYATQHWGIYKTVKENIYGYHHMTGSGDILDGALMQRYDSIEKIKSAVKNNKELIALAQKEKPKSTKPVVNNEKTTANPTTPKDTKPKAVPLVKGTTLPAGYYYRENSEEQYVWYMTQNGQSLTFLSEYNQIYEMVGGTEKQFIAEILTYDMREFTPIKILGKNKFSSINDVITYSFKNNILSYTMTPKGLTKPQKCDPYKYIGSYEDLKKMLLKNKK